MATLPAPRPELQAPPTNPSFGGTTSTPVAGTSPFGFGAAFQELQKATEGLDPLARSMVFMDYMNQQRREQEKKDFPEMLKSISQMQFENAQRAQQLGAQSTVFGGVVKSLLDLGNIPRRMAAARQMYGPETISGFRLPTEALERQQPRYF